MNNIDTFCLPGTTFCPVCGAPVEVAKADDGCADLGWTATRVWQQRRCTGCDWFVNENNGESRKCAATPHRSC